MVDFRFFSETLGAPRGQLDHFLLPRSMKKLKTGRFLAAQHWPDNLGQKISRFVLEKSLKFCISIVCFPLVYFSVFWEHLRTLKNVLSAVVKLL